MDITLYHNPACGTSRNTLALLRERGFEPVIVEYLKTPLDQAGLERVLADAGLQPSELIRAKEALYAELGLDQPGVSEAQLLAAMVEHPRLMNRPVVVTPLGTRLCRPKEVVLEILPPAGE